MNAATALKPENLRQTYKAVSAKVKQMTWLQLFMWLLVLGFHTIKAIGFGVYLLLLTIFRFAYYLTMPAKDDEEKKEALPQENHLPAFAHPILPEFHHTKVGVDAFGLSAERLPPPPDTEELPEHEEHIPNGHVPTGEGEDPASPKTPSPPGSVHGKAPRLVWLSIEQIIFQPL